MWNEAILITEPRLDASPVQSPEQFTGLRQGSAVILFRQFPDAWKTMSNEKGIIGQPHTDWRRFNVVQQFRGGFGIRILCAIQRRNDRMALNGFIIAVEGFNQAVKPFFSNSYFPRIRQTYFLSACGNISSHVHQ